MLGSRLPDHSPDDFELIRGWRSGDQLARDALFSRHYGRIRRFFDVKVPAAAEDLTQQTFLACIELVDQIEKPGSFKAFVFSIARHRLLRYLRSARRTEGPSPIESFADSATSPSGIVARNKEHWLLLRAMERLPTDLRIALELFYWEDMRSSEIAQVLRIPLSTVTTRISRARTRLRSIVEELSAGAVDAGEHLDNWAKSMVVHEDPQPEGPPPRDPPTKP